MAPQFSLEQRNFLMLEYHKRRGTMDFLPGLIADFQAEFPGARIPALSTIRKIYKKQKGKGTVLNCNSAKSPGDSNSGRRRTSRTPENKEAVKEVMDRDAPKRIGDATVSPVSTCRRNTLALAKSSWSRIKTELRYHPYKPIRRHELKPQDLPRRLQFCQWLVTRTDAEMLQLLVTDEANFALCGAVNSQNVRRYAPLKTSDPEEGGRPEHFTVDTPTYDQKLMVFCGMNRDGTFGFSVFRNETMNGPRYHRMLQHTVLPELRAWNGGTLDALWWQQDGAPCHVTAANMRYLDRQFEDRVLSRKPIRGRDWPARSPDLNPCDFCLWGFLKSKVNQSINP
jgi:inhibitor of nuclear factor kappa-B kinase subunit alpha